jgi:hypothetical protein
VGFRARLLVAATVLTANAVTSSPTLVPTVAPTHTLAPSLTSSPTVTPGPTMKPTMFPTAISPTSGNASIVEALIIMLLMAFFGLVLGLGNVKQDYDRAQKKMKKILDYNNSREEWRQLLLPNAKKEDLIENIETFKEKFYPGDRVVVLDRPPPPKKGSKQAVLPASSTPLPAVDATKAKASDTGGDATEGGAAEASDKEVEGGAPAADVDDDGVELASVDKKKKEDDEKEEDDKKDEKKKDDSKKDEDASKELGVAAVWDTNNDGILTVEELEAAAKGVPRGRIGVVTKLVDSRGQYVIEFDDEESDSDSDGEDEEDSSDSDNCSEDDDIDSEDEDTSCSACFFNGCKRPKTKREKRAKAKRESKKDRIIKVHLPKGAKPGMLVACPTGRKDEMKEFVVPKRTHGRIVRVVVPGLGSKKKLKPPKPAPLPKFSKKLYNYDIIGISSKIDQEVFTKYPDRDYDDEELDEIADLPNALFMILELFFYPLRVLLYEMCCRVQKVKKIVAAETDEPISLRQMEEEEDEGFIDGFPIDCGTKNRKYLSMAKCVAVTAARHPHIELYEDGEHYVKPYELHLDTGQHNLEWAPGKECFEKYGCLKPKGFMQNYGIGMSLYFKFVKTLSIAFFCASIIAIFPMSYYWQTSAWNTREKALFLNNPSTRQKYQVFYTTMGSLGGRSYVCGNGYEDERMELSCQSGTIQRLEAYYGDPYGSCTCPNDQLPLTSTDRAGSCPADPNYKNDIHGECLSEYGNADDHEGIKPCFKGQMWTGETCCAYNLNPSTHTVDLDDLAMTPNRGCNSASAQFIMQGLCLGQTNCTIDVKSNVTTQWEVTKQTPCGEGEQAWDDEVNQLVCRASLNSPNSNFTNCPTLSDRRLIIRGLCSESEFDIDPSFRFGNGNGKHEKRAEWAKAMSYLDAIITAMVFWVALWMAEKEEEAVHINDMHSCSVDDFTLRILKLEPLKKGRAPDLDKLKRNIKKHFDDLLIKAKPVVFDRPVKVVDINFGLNNQETIKNMKLRGALARLLDLHTEKLELMRQYGIHSEKELIKQSEAVRIHTVHFIEMCEKVKYRKSVLQARTAFITFASEEGYERCRQLYCKPFWFGQPKKLKYKKKAIFRMTTVMRPSDYIWEHLSTAPIVRFTKISISNLLALSILVLGFACIIKVKGIENSAKVALGEADCTTFDFVYSGDPSWESALAVNATISETTRLDVAKTEYASYYNNSYPTPGLLGCFCLHVNEVASEDAVKVEFLNPNTKKTEYLCDDFFTEYQYIQTMSTLAVGAVVVVNELLKTVFRALVEFEGHETRTEEILAHTIKLFGSMLMNTAFIVVLIAGNLTVFLGGKNDSTTRTLSAANLMSGDIGDLNSEWYLEVGTAIVVTMYINIFALNTKVIQDSVKMKLMRCLDRGCTFDMTRTNQKLQVQLETLYTGPQLLLEERYAALLVGFFVCMIFSAGMPILWIVGFVTFLVSFLVDKWAFLRVYRLPPKYGPTLARFATNMLPIGVLLHVFLATWSFSAPELFDYENLTVEYVNNTHFNPKTSAVYTNTSYQGQILRSEGANTYDFWEPDNGGATVMHMLERAGTHPNTPPHVFLIVVWVFWFILIRIFGFQNMVIFCARKCGKGDADFAEANESILARQAEVRGVAVADLGSAPEEVIEEVKVGDSGAMVDTENGEPPAVEVIKPEEAEKKKAADELVVTGPAIVSDDDPLHHHDGDGKGTVTQTALKVSEQARITYINMIGHGPADGEEKEKFEANFQKFLELWQSESGIAAVESFFPEDEKPTFDVAMESMSYDFRDRWLSMCEFIQANRGHRAIEGNADYIWSIPSEEMTYQIHKGVLSVEMLAMFQKELNFRKKHPELHLRVTRRLQGLVSFDYNANEEYVEAFALDSKSLKNFKRGNIQVSGADYELAQRGIVNYLISCIAGPRPLGTSFPDIQRDVHGIVARHTTQIGIVPTEITGPRFVLNVKVPPPPPDLSKQSINDPSYDEYAEKWQFLRVSVKGVFDYRVRLPRGLQYRKIPEIQIEVPAFEQKFSTVETALIGGKVRSIYEEYEDEVEDDEEEKEEMRRLRKQQLKALKNEQSEENMEVKTINAKTVSVAEQNEKKNQEQEIAATKIQAVVRKRQRKKKQASKMRSWQAVTLRRMESFGFLFIILGLVALDIGLQITLADSRASLVTTIGFLISVFFLVELSLRFYCYAHISRGDGLDCGDFDFFTSDKMRLLDLIIVIMDWLGIIILALVQNPSSSSAIGLKFVKSGRIVRIARLARFLRMARCLKMQMLGYDFGWALTGKERMGMQRFHINAPKEVDKGNRIVVSIPTLGKVHIDFPLYSAQGTPIQFHLPVVCDHHLDKKLTPSCHIVKPDPIHCNEVEYRTTVGQLGWCNLWNPLDDSGLGLPYEKRGYFKRKPKVKGKDMDGDGIDDFDANGIPLDARQQQIQRMVAGKDLAGGDGEGAKEKMEAAYGKYYQDYTRHRVWYQVMAFAPRTVVKDFQNLKMFRRDIERYRNDAVITLRDGHYKGERIETTMKLGQGKPDGQKQWVHIPGVGDCEATLSAVDQVVMPGLHNLDCLALAVLPWGDRPVERLELVPEAISEISFDFPAILLPMAVEVVKKGMSKEQQEEAELKEAAREEQLERDKEAGISHSRFNFFHKVNKDDARVSGHTQEGSKVKFLERDTFVKTFEVKSKSRIAVEKALKQLQLAKERSEKGFLGFGRSRAGKLADEKRKRAEVRAKRAEKKKLRSESLEREAKANGEGGGGDVETPPNNNSASIPADETVAEEVPVPTLDEMAPEEQTAAAAVSMFAPTKKPATTGTADGKDEKKKTPDEADQTQVTRELRHMHYENHSTELINLPKVGRFHVTWPAAGEGAIAKHKARMAAFKVNFPAIKPHRHISEDVKSLLPLPKDNSSLSATARRYQVGWVILEMPSAQAEGGGDFKVYLRLPAYVSHRNKALSKLPTSDEASPWNMNVSAHHPEDATTVVTSPLLTGDEDIASVKKKAQAIADKLAKEAAAREKFEAENQRLNDEIALLKSGGAPKFATQSPARKRPSAGVRGGRGGSSGGRAPGKPKETPRSRAVAVTKSETTESTTQSPIAPSSPTSIKAPTSNGSVDSVASNTSGINPLSEKKKSGSLRGASIDRPPPAKKKSPPTPKTAVTSKDENTDFEFV